MRNSEIWKKKHQPYDMWPVPEDSYLGSIKFLHLTAFPYKIYQNLIISSNQIQQQQQ